MPVHAVLECFASIDEYYGHLIVVLLPKLGVGIYVHLAPPEVRLALDLRKDLLNDVAEMTPFARIDDHVMHVAIVNASVFHGFTNALRSLNVLTVGPNR